MAQSSFSQIKMQPLLIIALIKICSFSQLCDDAPCSTVCKLSFELATQSLRLLLSAFKRWHQAAVHMNSQQDIFWTGLNLPQTISFIITLNIWLSVIVIINPRGIINCINAIFDMMTNSGDSLTEHVARRLSPLGQTNGSMFVSINFPGNLWGPR